MPHTDTWVCDRWTTTDSYKSPEWWLQATCVYNCYNSNYHYLWSFQLMKAQTIEF